MASKLTVWKLKIEIEVPGDSRESAMDNANNLLDDIMMSGGLDEEAVELTNTGFAPSEQMMEQFGGMEDRLNELLDEGTDEPDGEPDGESMGPEGRIDG